LISTFHAPDIECDGCANSIKRALGRIQGIQAVEVDVPTKHVTVTFGDDTTPADISAALDKAGFPVS
jgi:copper chaperone